MGVLLRQSWWASTLHFSAVGGIMGKYFVLWENHRGLKIFFRLKIKGKNLQSIEDSKIS